MRKQKVLVDPDQRDGLAKRVLADTDPSGFFPAAAGLGHKILRILAKGPDYPSNIARELKLYHQVVYYHMKRLEKAGLVQRVSEKTVRGGKASLYALTSGGYAVEFDVKGVEFASPSTLSRSEKLGEFLKEFISPEGRLEGWIVVGSPEAHGPNRTQGRDGHYAIQLGFALGQFVRLPTTFPVKLDVDLKAEKLQGSNLLVVGGPRTNLVAAELNPHLPIRFSEENFFGSIVDAAGRRYMSEFDSVVAKVANPWDASKVCVAAAGLSGAATKAAVIGLTNMADTVLAKYNGGEFAAVLHGVDMDGDGKVDSVEML
ncbi:MAG TPA: winged helix-turn-helix domain-containing protein [Nitrososphaerales archaeon]|nr:winged helix-turn-helix domain-containing protein [Nitrososphaerales archaeon]HUK74523.1 winged helix-turn-helix domain-containing protein [Nitrososphaerales archaeon]